MGPPSVYGPASATLPSSSGLDADPLADSPFVAAQDSDNDDGTIRTVDELVRRRARAYPDRVIVSYPSSGIAYVDYTMRQLDVFAYRVARLYEQRIPSRLTSDEKPTTVAVIGPSNFDYLVTMLALTKLGHTTLFLSTRISQEAVESLISVTGAQYLLADKRYLETAEAAKLTVPHLDVFEIAGQSTFDFPIEVHADTRLDYGRHLSVEANNLVYIIHSSGSTGLPKPIYQTQKSAIHNYSSSMNLKAFITLPLYHNHGICNLYRAIYCGRPIHLYDADLPLTREHLGSVMREHDFEIFYGVPYALKLLAETEDGIGLLRQLKVVMYGGSACPDDLGDALVNNGVNLVGHYGATEVGQLMTSFRPPGDKAWNYVREHDRLAPYLKWIPRGPNLFECCVLPGWPAKVAMNQDDGSYCTKDLFEPHPTIPGAWKYIARLDDTIALVNGEKFNPVHMEGTIRSSKNVTECVVFGVGRPFLGVLIVPAAGLAGETDDEVLEAVWPVVEGAGRSVEAYACISKNMIKLLPHDCAYPRTDKGSVIRQAFYKTYAADIDEVYDNADAGGGADLRRLGLPELRDFVRERLVRTLSKKVELVDDDDTDFFSLGLDSLQAIQMRSDILKTVDVGGNKLGQTVVFDHPSVSKLSAYLHGLGTGGEAAGAPQVTIESEMRELIDKYGDFSPIEPAPRSSVAVTGATGSLGAHIVARLAAEPAVKTIYCFTRAGSDADAARRVKSSLIQRRLYHALPASSRRKLVALAADLADAGLGLGEEAYARVRRDLRLVIHAAWSVNFNMRLSSFEKSNIAGVNHLIALCRQAGDAGAGGGGGSSPASFNFCSSVSTVARATTTPVPEAAPELEWAQGMGYAQSKAVAEHLCARAAEAGVKARVLRIGQIVADTRHGVWNATEAIPLMLQTAVTVGALPRLRETPSWLPVDTVARAVVDISLSDAGAVVFANVTNPRTFGWIDELLPALRAAGLEFDEVEPREWVRRLRASDPDPVANPPIKLVDFFASKYDGDEFAPPKAYATDNACSLSPALARAPVLDQQLVDSFVGYFRANHWAAARERGPARTVVVVAGPCGSGKSTLAASLASWLRAPFVEGDSLHSKGAVDKMGGSVALADEDRAAWLGRVGRRAVEAVEELGYDSVVVSCSALRKSYRDTLRAAVGGRDGVRVVFLDLQCDPDTLAKRVSESKGHYMPASMVGGQVEVYEAAGVGELDVVPVEAEGRPEEVFDEAKWLLGQIGVN
ncbi:male sterility protein [Colletotrichum falcatum]|nr:male sterility protein [Colletotrichum falcatum]